MNLADRAAEASKLSEEQRASLASQLLHELETPAHDVSDQEVFRRIEEAEKDPSVMISFNELVSGLRKSLSPSHPSNRSGAANDQIVE